MAPGVHITPTDDGQFVEIDKKVAYGDANSPAAGFAKLCTLTAEGATHRLIHRNLGKTGFEVLILRQQSAGISLAVPQIVASARYKADGPPAVLPHTTDADPLPLTPVLLNDAPVLPTHDVTAHLGRSMPSGDGHIIRAELSPKVLRVLI